MARRRGRYTRPPSRPQRPKTRRTPLHLHAQQRPPPRARFVAASPPLVLHRSREGQRRLPAPAPTHAHAAAPHANQGPSKEAQTARGDGCARNTGHPAGEGPASRAQNKEGAPPAQSQAGRRGRSGQPYRSTLGGGRPPPIEEEHPPTQRGRVSTRPRPRPRPRASSPPTAHTPTTRGKKRYRVQASLAHPTSLAHKKRRASPPPTALHTHHPWEKGVTAHRARPRLASLAHGNVALQAPALTEHRTPAAAVQTPRLRTRLARHHKRHAAPNAQGYSCPVSTRADDDASTRADSTSHKPMTTGRRQTRPLTTTPPPGTSE
ncbi:hypothetical protein C8J57DRAFT_1528273 [Mycena rebaudengoi]|nr:hypothetical protein C8J57DRAFT_1528273 [Mycena rebaudengoi]